MYWFYFVGVGRVAGSVSRLLLPLMVVNGEHFCTFLRKSGIMLSITGIYDGKSIYPVEAINEHRNYKVIITFVEELNHSEAEALKLRYFGFNNPALDFWDNPEEDIYQDYLTTKPKA